MSNIGADKLLGRCAVGHRPEASSECRGPRPSCASRSMVLDPARRTDPSTTSMSEGQRPWQRPRRPRLSRLQGREVAARSAGFHAARLSPISYETPDVMMRGGARLTAQRTPSSRSVLPATYRPNPPAMHRRPPRGLCFCVIYSAMLIKAKICKGAGSTLVCRTAKRLCRECGGTGKGPALRCELLLKRAQAHDQS